MLSEPPSFVGFLNYIVLIINEWCNILENPLSMFLQFVKRLSPKALLFLALFTIISGGLKRDINVEPSALSDQLIKQPNHQFA